MNKARKLAEDLVNKNAAIFSTDFDANKRAIDQIMTIRNRALRNQIAGAVTVLVRERAPKASQPFEASERLESEELGAGATLSQVAEVRTESKEQPSSSSQEKEDVEGETVQTGVV